MADLMDRTAESRGVTVAPRRLHGMIMSTPSTTPSRAPASPPESSTRISPPAIGGGEPRSTSVTLVATRRNDRNLTTSTGEPVRNRETWIVTAIGTDSSLTVTREQGHGTVTLPADYAHNHVRLGYAATEHGYQSDTVDHSVPLVSAVTTRRGLYVAATRGRDENVLCVITDSTTSPKPATPSRRFSPSTAPTSPPSPNAAPSPSNNRPRRPPSSDADTARCEIPEWFEPLLNELRGDPQDRRTDSDGQ